MENRRLHRSGYALLEADQVARTAWALSARVFGAKDEAVNQPFLPLFFGDFLAATAEWSGEERSLYLLCLAYQWSMGSLPTDPRRLAKLVDYERRAFDASWDQVSKKFVERDGRLYNLRLEEHRNRAKEIGKMRSDLGRAGGIKSGEARRRKAEANASDLLEANENQTGSNGFTFAEAKSNHPSHPIQDLNPKSRFAASSDDPRKALFDLGKTILGASSGGLISSAISRTNEAKVGEVLGHMAVSAKADPKAYFVAATTPKERGAVC